MPCKFLRKEDTFIRHTVWRIKDFFTSLGCLLQEEVIWNPETLLQRKSVRNICEANKSPMFCKRFPTPLPPLINEHCRQKDRPVFEISFQSICSVDNDAVSNFARFRTKLCVTLNAALFKKPCWWVSSGG